MVVALFNELELALHDEHTLEHKDGKWHLMYNGESVCEGSTLYRLTVHYYFNNKLAIAKRKLATAEIKPEEQVATQEGLF